MRLPGSSVNVLTSTHCIAVWGRFLAITAVFGILGCSPTEESAEVADFDYRLLYTSDSLVDLSLELMHQTQLAFPVSSMVNWNSDTSVALVESQEQRGVILGLDGKVLFRFGRKGGGPGELTGGIQLFPGHEGRMAAVDLALNRIAIFDADASPGPTILISGRPIKLLGFDEDTLTLLVHGMSGRSTSNLVAYYSWRTGNLLDEREVSALGATADMSRDGATPGIAVVAMGDSSDLYLADPIEYRLTHVAADLTLLSAVEPPGTEPLYLSKEVIAERMDGALRGLEGAGSSVRTQAASALETTLSAQQPHFGPYSMTAGGGRVFVARRLASGRASVIDVFEDGHFLGSFGFPLVIQGIDASSNRLAFIASPDPFGADHEQTLFTYRLVAREEAG